MKLRQYSVIAYQDGKGTPMMDDCVVESSLEILINGRPSYYCMRMPGMDRELALGLCFHDGRIDSADDIKNIIQEDDSVIRIDMSESRNSGSEELRIIRSSSGTFRKDRDSLPNLRKPEPDENYRFSVEMLFTMQENFFSRQEIFVKTGGTHAAALYGKDGGFLAFAEDVGRHNALDKCVGRLLLDGKLADACFCMLSSRLSYEMVLKSGRAGAKVIAGSSAPTSLAVTLARDSDLTLIGFLRQPRFTVYSGEWRIDSGSLPQS